VNLKQESASRSYKYKAVSRKVLALLYLPHTTSLGGTTELVLRAGPSYWSYWHLLAAGILTTAGKPETQLATFNYSIPINVETAGLCCIANRHYHRETVLAEVTLLDHPPGCFQMDSEYQIIVRDLCCGGSGG